MEKEFIPYDRALKLKALGFNEPCISFYSNGSKHNYDVQSPCTNIGSWSDQEHYCSAPTFSQAFRWFRKKYFYLSYVCAPYKEYNEFYFRIRYIGDVLNEGELESCESQVYRIYEEAELSCLDKLIEIVELNKNKDEKN